MPHWHIGRCRHGGRSTVMVSEIAGADEHDLARLQDERRQLEVQVSAQASELSLLRARFERYETALRGSLITVYTQDRDLRYTSISNPMLGREIEDILGRTDAEIFPEASRSAIIDLKNEVLASGHAKTRGNRDRRRTRAALARFAGRATAQRCWQHRRPDLRGHRRHRAQGGRGASASAAARVDAPLEESARR